METSVVVLPKMVVKPRTSTSGLWKAIRMAMLSSAESQKCHSYFTNETNKQHLAKQKVFINIGIVHKSKALIWKIHENKLWL